MPGESAVGPPGGVGGGGGGGLCSSAVPLRILNKGPEYFRRQTDSHPKRLSAVERLEADKAKYVKSQEVINARQEPIKPQIPPSSPSHTPNPALPQGRGPRRAGSSPALKASSNNNSDACRPGNNNLNLELLKNLLNGSGDPVLPRTTASGRKRSSRSWAPRRSERSEPADELHVLHQRRSFAESLRVFPSHSHSHHGPAYSPNLNLDLLPSPGLPRSRDPWLHVSHSSSDIRRVCRRAAPATAPAEPYTTPAAHLQGHAPETGGGASSETGCGAKRRPSLRRSKSDLSERQSVRAKETDLERFFNQCGLDAEELELLGLQGLTAGADISTLGFHHGTASTAGGSEPGGRGSRRSDEEDEEEEDEEEDLMDEEDEEDRVPYGISAVERNARVIKWLYSIRQNRQSQRVSHV
ncbi:hypothetical protein GJAV_G00090250 [Gymnothorax javanicus]|nr:hypothetical protein GJAV_G00090250 [Gymnothorax javanicus]